VPRHKFRATHLFRTKNGRSLAASNPHFDRQGQFAAFLATPEESTRTGVVILPDIRGLHPFYEQLAVRVAEQGHSALAIDYFGRTAGTAPRDESFQHMEHILRVSRQTIDADILTGASFSAPPKVLNAKLSSPLGFCFGGRQAFFASAARFGFTGVIGYYGALGLYPNGATGPLQHVAELSAPILGLFGGADHGISGKDVAPSTPALTLKQSPPRFRHLSGRPAQLLRH